MSTSSNKSQYPFADTAMVRFLTRRIEELKPDVTQSDIARRLGYRCVNFVSMMKTGAARVPLEKLPLLAEILDVDPAHLVRLGLEQYWPELNVVARVLPAPITRNELELLKVVRTATDSRDPELTADQRAAVERVFATVAASPRVPAAQGRAGLIGGSDRSVRSGRSPSPPYEGQCRPRKLDVLEGGHASEGDAACAARPERRGLGEVERPGPLYDTWRRTNSRMIGLTPPTDTNAFAFPSKGEKFDPGTLEYAPDGIRGARPRIDRTLLKANDRVERDNRLVGESLTSPTQQRACGPNLARRNHRQR